MTASVTRTAPKRRADRPGGGARRSALRAGRLVVAAVALCCTLVASLSCAPPEPEGPRYPGDSWEVVVAPAELGYSPEALADARSYTETIDTAAVMIVVDGAVLDQWGEIDRKFNVHSIRKSFLSAMYGIHVAAGNIDLTATMSDLGVDDDEPSLTEIEKTATVEMLLKARSGIYHPALYETTAMAERRPQRHSHEPGTFWYYNNWDFNTLGTIFRNLAHADIHREFGRLVAEPIGMQDYDPSDGAYVVGEDSVHPAYPFRMTARDMARFGLLFARGGEWRGEQIVPRDWVRASVTSHSDAGDSGGYGYLWWVAVDGRHLGNVTLGEGAYSARGAGGHYILVIPSHDMVIVHRVDTDVPENRVSGDEFGALVKMVLDAKVDPS